MSSLSSHDEPLLEQIPNEATARLKNRCKRNVTRTFKLNTSIYVFMEVISFDLILNHENFIHEIAPLNPENHITNCILFVILCSRNLLTKCANGNILHARPIKHRMSAQMTSANSQR